MFRNVQLTLEQHRFVLGGFFSNKYSQHFISQISHPQMQPAMDRKPYFLHSQLRFSNLRFPAADCKYCFLIQGWLKLWMRRADYS